jgi:hypothetical protein
MSRDAAGPRDAANGHTAPDHLKANDVAISTMNMIATSVRTSILTSSAGFPLGHPGRDKFNN